jgi:hypothetical protein
MYKDAQEIFGYLPIEAGSENLYIQHLFGAFLVVNEKEEPIRAFSILPFHLLFMLAVQYRVYRISAWRNNDYLSILKNCRTFRKDDRYILIYNAPIPDSRGVISMKSSVRNLSKIKEGYLFHFFKIIGLSESIIRRAKFLVDIRGTYAHANGNIEKNIEARISEYLEVLREIQKCMQTVNKAVQNWAGEFEVGEFPLDDFFRERFLQSQFCPHDFGDIIGTLLEAEKPDFDQWTQIVNKGLELAYDQTISVLHSLAKSEINDGKRFNAIRVLQENGEIDEEAKMSIIEKEADAEILKLLKK